MLVTCYYNVCLHFANYCFIISILLLQNLKKMSSRAHKIIQLTKAAANKSFTTQPIPTSEENNSVQQTANSASMNNESQVTKFCESVSTFYEGNDVLFSEFNDEDIMSAPVIIVNADNSVYIPNSDEVVTTTSSIQTVGEHIVDPEVDQYIVENDNTNLVKHTMKRKVQSETKDGKKEWKRSKTTNCRMIGSSYVGYRRKNNKVTHDADRAARSQEPTCRSKTCLKSRNRFCDSFSEEQRKIIFKRFWERS